MALYAPIVTTLGALAIAAIVTGLILGFSVVLAGGRERLVGALSGNERHPIGWAWGIAVIAMAGSLYLSEVAHLVPCSLCWYQRIAMYPLVFVLGVATVRSDASVWRYGLPLAVVGLVIAIYHVTIQWQPSLDIGACNSGAPCTGRYLAVFGFVSIPVMAGGAFLLITSLLLLIRSLERESGASV
ncbi:MAG: disulfide oxidoreductase [Longimicrobiales bacterium]